jgi:hypothetical protein
MRHANMHGGVRGFIVAWGKFNKKPFNSYDFGGRNISEKFFVD